MTGQSEQVCYLPKTKHYHCSNKISFYCLVKAFREFHRSCSPVAHVQSNTKIRGTLFFFILLQQKESKLWAHQRHLKGNCFVLITVTWYCNSTTVTTACVSGACSTFFLAVWLLFAAHFTLNCSTCASFNVDVMMWKKQKKQKRSDSKDFHRMKCWQTSAWFNLVQKSSIFFLLFGVLLPQLQRLPSL